MSETRTAVGTLAGITEKPTGWSTISVALPGKQHPLRMDTKKQELIELARAAGQNAMEWTYTEEDSGTPNPNRPGSNYLNRRFEGVAPVGENSSGSVVTPDTAAFKNGSEGMSKEEWARKDRAADLRACIAIVAGALQHTVKSEPSNDDLNEFATRVLFVARQFHGVVWSERAEDDGVPFLSEHDQSIPF